MNPANPLPFQLENPGDANRFQVLHPVVDSPLERSCRAFDHKLDREVILKFSPVAQWQEWSVPVRDRIAREAKVMAKIRSDQVLQIFDVLQSDAGPVIVMELPEGEPLAERLKGAPFSPAETKRIAIEICRALAALHLASVVYRALGPASVLVTAAGKVKLADFTFAKNHGGGLGVASLSPNMEGKARDALKAHLPPYPAPEMLSGRDAEPRGDIFALGCLMYRCLVGVDPFALAGEMQPVQDLRKARPDCPPELAEVIRKCMSVSKAARFATAIEVEQALAACPDELVVARRSLLLAGIAAAVVLGGGAWWFTRNEAQAVRNFEPGYGNRWALLIGINRYENSEAWDTLKTAENDVEVVHQRLRHLGWEEGRIRKLIRPTRSAVLQALADINQDIDQSGDNDALMVYFAGHGIQQQDRSVLLPADAAPGNATAQLEPRDFSDRLVAPKHVLYVFDACHSAGMKGVAELEQNRGRALSSKAKGVDDALYLKYTTGLWRGVLWSATSTEVASDGMGNSPFCKAFCEALDPAGPLFQGEQFKKGGALPLNDVNSFIQKALASRNQGPAMHQNGAQGSESDTFVFTLPKPGG